jgi:hypothetical protein
MVTSGRQEFVIFLDFWTMGPYLLYIIQKRREKKVRLGRVRVREYPNVSHCIRAKQNKAFIIKLPGWLA